MSDLLSPDWGSDWDADPDAEAIAFCEEQGLVDDGAGGWIDPKDPAYAPPRKPRSKAAKARK